MKVLVMSDSHENKNVMLMVVARELPELILHLGDCARDCAAIEAVFPEIPLRSVIGNCDRSFDGLDIDEFVLGGRRFFMTHGHLYGVKTGLTAIIEAAVCRGADVLLYGHTHIQDYFVRGGLTVVNPGSVGLGERTYAVLDLKNGVVGCDIKQVQALQ